MRKIQVDWSRRFLALSLGIALVMAPQVPSVFAAGPAGNVVLKGNLTMAATGAPVTGARVYAVHLDTKQVFTSAPSGAAGEYQITGLPFGYFDVAVETPQGLFLANRVVNAPAGEKIELPIQLGPPRPEDTEWWSAEPDRKIPGLNRVPDGVARLGGSPSQKLAAARVGHGVRVGTGATGAKAGSSWLAPTLAAAGVVALAVIINNQQDEKETQVTTYRR